MTLRRFCLHDGVDRCRSASAFKAIQTVIPIADHTTEKFPAKNSRRSNMSKPLPQLLGRIAHPSVAASNKRLAALVQDGDIAEAHRLFEEMREKTTVSYTILMGAYSEARRVDEARQLFDKMPDRDTVAWNAMITCYVRNGHLQDAQSLFQQMPHKNSASWNALIAGYANSGLLAEACKIFRQMPESKRNAISWTTLLAAYLRNYMPEQAELTFRSMPCKTVASWNAMIAGLLHNALPEDALKFFRDMLATGTEPDGRTLASTVTACAVSASLSAAVQVHAHVLKRNHVVEGGATCIVGNALITMYAKCGRLQESRTVFERMSVKDLVSWNAMISANAQHGHAEDALKLFHRMLDLHFKPDEVSFISVLFACGYAGRVDEGCTYFEVMRRQYNIVPKIEHYVCMVDLLGRAGRLLEAETLIEEMPIEPNAVVWKALLAACRLHSDIEMAGRVADRLFAVEPNNCAGHVLLSNIYAAAGRWEDVARVRVMMREKGIRKEPGCSWIQVRNVVHVFVADDKSHPQIEEIMGLLRRLLEQTQRLGYVPDVKFGLLNGTDEEKEEQLCYHSERLAIAFGILGLPGGSPIHVMKNLRMCGDCHSATKFISKIVEREIIVRDTVRFHNFKDGICSCNDYW